MVFGRDKNILERDAELRTYLDAKIHMFLLPGELNITDILSLLSRNLRDICSLAVARRASVYWLTDRGVIPIEIRLAARQRRRQRAMTRRRQA